MEEDIKKLIRENTKLTQRVEKISTEINETTKKIRRFTIISEIMGFIKLLVIFVPIILGILFLPPIFQEYKSKYQQFFGLGTSIGGGSDDVLQNALMNVMDGMNPKNINTDELSPDLLKILNTR